MTEQELREMDVTVHRALSPESAPAQIDGYWYARKPGSFSMDRVPRYSTDLSAWDAVYAHKPEWQWITTDGSWGKGAGYVVTRLDYGGTWDSVESVDEKEATGLAAYALGRARCVIAWKEAQG